MPKNWEDKFILGEAGFYYVIIGDRYGGYFHHLSRARRFVRNVVNG